MTSLHWSFISSIGTDNLIECDATIKKYLHLSLDGLEGTAVDTGVGPSNSDIVRDKSVITKKIQFKMLYTFIDRFPHARLRLKIFYLIFFIKVDIQNL